MVSNSTTLSSIVTKSSNLELDGMEEVGYLCLANGDTVVERMEFDSLVKFHCNIHCKYSRYSLERGGSNSSC